MPPNFLCLASSCVMMPAEVVRTMMPNCTCTTLCLVLWLVLQAPIATPCACNTAHAGPAAGLQPNKHGSLVTAQLAMRYLAAVPSQQALRISRQVARLQERAYAGTAGHCSVQQVYCNVIVHCSATSCSCPSNAIIHAAEMMGQDCC